MYMCICFVLNWHILIMQIYEIQYDIVMYIYCIIIKSDLCAYPSFQISFLCCEPFRYHVANLKYAIYLHCPWSLRSAVKLQNYCFCLVVTLNFLSNLSLTLVPLPSICWASLYCHTLTSRCCV